MTQHPFNNDAFGDHNVVVIGGTSGIGAAIAATFAGLGADVIAAGLRAKALSTIGSQNLDAIELDVTRAEEVASLFNGLRRLHVLVNCAGTISRRDEYDLDTFRHVLEVNLVGSMRTAVAASELLRVEKGCIVNVGSMYTFFGSPHAPAYGASKAGIAQLTKSLAIAFAPEVRVNAVAPGWIRTDLTAPVQDDAAASQRILQRTPAGRWGDPDDVAGTVAYLASAASRFVTGAIIPVDGGYSVM